MGLKISELTETTTLSNSAMLAVAPSGGTETNKVSILTLRGFIHGDLITSDDGAGNVVLTSDITLNTAGDGSVVLY